MLDSSGPNRVETRRILVCPYCGRLQRVIISPAPFGIECMRCHRVFLVSHNGAVAIPAAALVDAWQREPSNTLSRTPGQVFIDPQVGPAEKIDEPGPSRSRADQSRGMLPWLRSVVITLVILGAVVGVARVVVVMAESIYNAIRQAVEGGSMTTFERSEIESLREPGPGAGAPQGAAPRGSVIHNQE